MKRNNLIYTGLVSCLLMATTACSDYLDINQNPEYPTEASSSTLLSFWYRRSSKYCRWYLRIIW